MTTVAAMQPQFIPWLGYLELAANADVFLFLDDFQLSRQSWSTRNRLFVGYEKAGWISIDLDHSSSVGSTFLEVREAPGQEWRARLRSIFRNVYKPCPYVSEVEQVLDMWLTKDFDSVAHLELFLFEYVTQALGLGCQVVRSSEVEIGECRRSERVRALISSVGATTYLAPAGSIDYMVADGGWDRFLVLVQDHTPIVYPQFHSRSFVPRLGFLDALANVGWAGLTGLLHGTSKWGHLER